MVGSLPKALNWEMSFWLCYVKEQLEFCSQSMGDNIPESHDSIWHRLGHQVPLVHKLINILLIPFNKHKLEVNALGMFDSLLF